MTSAQDEFWEEHELLISSLVEFVDQIQLMGYSNECAQLAAELLKKCSSELREKKNR